MAKWTIRVGGQWFDTEIERDGEPQDTIAKLSLQGPEREWGWLELDAQAGRPTRVDVRWGDLGHKTFMLAKPPEGYECLVPEPGDEVEVVFTYRIGEE